MDDNHAVLMDRIYRHQRYIYDFTRKYYLFGRDRMIRELGLAPGQSAVEVGCGTARNLIKIARAYPGTQLYGLDASHEMLKTAERAIARAGLTGQIVLAHGYAEDLSPALFGRDRPFDRITFSYALSMIPDWKQSLTRASGALAPNGSVHVVDFGDLKGLGVIGERILRGWLALFHVEPRDEILKAVETGGVQKNRKSKALRILFGRYAFVMRCSGQDIEGIVN